MKKCYDHEECEYNAQPDCVLPEGAQCPHGVPTVPPVTNADKIRAMSDEELASEMNQRSILTICDIVCQGDCKAIATLNKTSGEVCEEIIMEWLRQKRRPTGSLRSPSPRS